MRTFVLAALLFLPLPTIAQSALRATLIAEFAGGLAQPHDAAFSPDGKLIYVTDMRNSRIQVLEAMTLKAVGSFGAGELSYPHDAEFDRSGRLLVADTGNDRVQVFTTEGVYLTSWGGYGGGPGQFDYPMSIALGGDGRIYVADTFNRRIQVFGPAPTAASTTSWGRLKASYR